MTATVIQIARVAAVIALLGIAAAIATPKGRVPLALRGLARTMGRPISDSKGARVPLWKRLLAFLIVLAAVVLTFI